MNSNSTRRVFDHPLIGSTQVYRADAPPYVASEDTEPGTLIVGNGMAVKVVALFWNWNEVEGLDMAYVFCPETGEPTHVTPRDLGHTEPLTERDTAAV